jgi:hypothetical protein
MKDTREIAKEYRMGHWAEIMRERAESGLSIRAYCEREGMHPNRYHYWQRRLRAAAAAKEMLSARGETVRAAPAGWTELSVAEDKANTMSEAIKGTELTIEIGKCRVKANEETDTELLKKVCETLVRLC